MCSGTRTRQLSLCILLCLTSPLQTGFLALLHAGVASEIARLAHSLFPLRVDTQQGAGHGVTNGASLTAGPATNDAHGHRIGIGQIEYAQRRTECGNVRVTSAKIPLRGLAIDRYTAITIGIEAHAGNRRFAPPHSIIILTFDGIGHDSFSSSLLSFSSRGGLFQ